jgi:hypothetical protein
MWAQADLPAPYLLGRRLRSEVGGFLADAGAGAGDDGDSFEDRRP